jgi:hypothetical protein
MKQNTQNITYITIRIHKHNNKNTQFTKLNRSIQNILTALNTYKRAYKTYSDLKHPAFREVTLFLWKSRSRRFGVTRFVLAQGSGGAMILQNEDSALL